MNKNNHSFKVKNEIIFLLSNPQTATDLKEKMPHISSTGTIAYHLKNLEKEGMIVREVKEHVRGKPVYYYLAALKSLGFGLNSLENLQKFRAERKEKVKLSILKELKKSPQNAYELFKKYDKNSSTGEHLDADELLFHPNKYLELEAKITPEGIKYIKDSLK